jgi:2-dehydro-3-deoxy-D-arabinonate dehydratase
MGLMRLVKLQDGGNSVMVGIIEGETISPLSFAGGQYQSLSDILEADDPTATAEFLVDAKARKIGISEVRLLPPIDRQEVWAAGVTYTRSRTARMEESDAAASAYDRVYVADRPELFLKATARRVVGQHQGVRIRQDATWNVPEPELALVLNSRMELVGYTIGNDMSSRDIEGENPLYLPQAKVYDACCSLGPCITLAAGMVPASEIDIKLWIQRGEAIVFKGETSVARMARSLDNLIDYLGRDQTFPDGVVLLTGTGIVPPNDFTLQAKDIVKIFITGIGTLSNPVVRG